MSRGSWGISITSHGVAGKIGELSKRLENNAIAQAKQFDEPAWWSIAGELSKEIVLKTVPGAKWLWKSVRKTQNSGCSFDELKYTRERICRLASENSNLKEMRERVSRLESENASSKEMRKRVSRLESENLSLKETSERISLLEFEISSMREKMNELQQERIMLLASMLTLATHAETKSWKTRATLLTPLQSLAIDAEDSASRLEEDSMSKLEGILNYRFKNKGLLKEAITHSSIKYTEPYDRLEFVGDSVLGYLVTKHLYSTYPDLQQGILTLLRSQNVDNEKFARVCVKHGFHQFLLLNTPALQRNIEDFVKDIEDESKSFRCGDFKPPKVLADIVESIAGAVFVDSRYSSDRVWEVFQPLLEPLVSPETLELHPVAELQELYGKGKAIEYKYCCIDNMVRFQVLINGHVVGNGESHQKDLAERVAAKDALDKLKREDKVDNSSKDEEQTRNHEQPKVAQQKLNNLCVKKHWRPVYKLVKEEGPSHEKKYVYSVCVYKGSGWTEDYVGDEMPRENEAKESAAKLILDFLPDK